jgi:hypothetical protein
MYELARSRLEIASDKLTFRMAPSSGVDMNETALLTCLDWVAQRSEIVQSIFRIGNSPPQTLSPRMVCRGALLIGPRDKISHTISDLRR